MPMSTARYRRDGGPRLIPVSVLRTEGRMALIRWIDGARLVHAFVRIEALS